MFSQEEQLEEYRKTKHQLKLLLESDGWGMLSDYYRSLKIGRRNQMFGMDAPGMDGAIELLKVKSELAGMDLIMTLPLILRQEADDEEHALLQVMENDNEST